MLPKYKERVNLEDQVVTQTSENQAPDGYGQALMGRASPNVSTYVQGTEEDFPQNNGRGYGGGPLGHNVGQRPNHFDKNSQKTARTLKSEQIGSRLYEHAQVQKH